MPEEAFRALCDVPGGNEAVCAIVDSTCGMEALIAQAAAADGWGHYLSGYDGEEIELGGGLFAYRVN